MEHDIRPVGVCRRWVFTMGLPLTARNHQAIEKATSRLALYEGDCLTAERSSMARRPDELLHTLTFLFDVSISVGAQNVLRCSVWFLTYMLVQSNPASTRCVRLILRGNVDFVWPSVLPRRHVLEAMGVHCVMYVFSLVRRYTSRLMGSVSLVAFFACQTKLHRSLHKWHGSLTLVHLT